MKLLFCLLALFVVSNAQDLSSLKVTLPDLPCLCKLAGSLSDGNCTFFCNTSSVQDSSCASPLEKDPEFESFSLGEIRSITIPTVEVDAEVTARIQAVFDEANAKCLNVTLTSLTAATESLVSAYNYGEYDELLKDIHDDATKSLSELSGYYVDGKFKASVDVEFEDERVIVEARAEVKTATGVDVLNLTKRNQEEALKKIKRYYAAYLKHLKVKAAVANSTVGTIVKILAQAKFYKCLANRINTETNVDLTVKLGFGTVQAALQLLVDKYDVIQCNARRAIRALVFISKRLEKFPQWLQAKVALSESVIADLNLRISSYAQYKEKSLDDIKVTMKQSGLLSKIAETVKSFNENVTDVTISYKSESTTKVEHDLKTFLVRAADETQAQFDAKIEDLKSYFKKAIAALAQVDEVSVAVSLTVSGTASVDGAKRSLLQNGANEYQVTGTSAVAPATGSSSPASVATFSAVILALISFLALIF